MAAFWGPSLEDIMLDGEAEYRTPLDLRGALPLHHCPVYTEGKHMGKFWERSLTTIPLEPLFPQVCVWAILKDHQVVYKVHR